MKALITQAGQFGPFASITQGADRWICDGVEFQFGVIGDATIGDYVPPPPPPAPVPASVTRAQAKLALLQSGLLDQVQPAIDGIADPVQKQAAQIEWDDRLTFERNAGALVAMASMLGMTDAQIDDLFRLAATL